MRFWAKLSACGLHSDIYGVLENWLQDLQSFVVVGGDCSVGSFLSNMVFQGVVWGAVLWNVSLAMLQLSLNLRVCQSLFTQTTSTFSKRTIGVYQTDWSWRI